jgi:hypothetical protein
VVPTLPDFWGIYFIASYQGAAKILRFQYIPKKSLQTMTGRLDF